MIVKKKTVLITNWTGNHRHLKGRRLRRNVENCCCCCCNSCSLRSGPLGVKWQWSRACLGIDFFFRLLSQEKKIRIYHQSIDLWAAGCLHSELSGALFETTGTKHLISFYSSCSFQNDRSGTSGSSGIAIVRILKGMYVWPLWCCAWTIMDQPKMPVSRNILHFRASLGKH